MNPAGLTALEISRRAQLRPIAEVAAQLGIAADDLDLYGRYRAKLSLGLTRRLQDAPPGKLVLMTAITPTPAGEGKTTTSIGLVDALNRIGRKAVVCLREPAIGPCFGMKGGGAGGGRAQVVPMEDINLHFNGDFHAVTSAHNLLAAMLDSHLHFGNALGIDVRRVLWRRVMDMNDRALRELVIGLGGAGNSMPRESGFDITAASEVMATLCFAESLPDLKERFGRIAVAWNAARRLVTANDLKAAGAMTVLMRYAIQPNLVQTLEGSPALIHGGPFGNIAHGCNSVTATKLGLRLAEFAVTEAGFGADLGAEKFLNIKCRKTGLRPDVAVLVATIRALKYHGGVKVADLGRPDVAALTAGLDNLRKHLENLRAFGLPVVVAVNTFPSDTLEEWQVVAAACAELGAPVARCEHFTRGGEGAEDLARLVAQTAATPSRPIAFTYADDLPLLEKVRSVARAIYGADDVVPEGATAEKLRGFEAAGFGALPVCMAKTQYSFSANPQLRNRPRGFKVPLRDARLNAGPGFVVIYTGEIMTMPGLPKVPAAEAMDIDADGNTVGLF
ncbi:formate--tetrahydrofolate ligase [Opitutus terrae]|uniref:Formate--tetrahydrofolate ligase n=1 Tax=Opitutus terrae (strain DSM 11246 / JCM 15787 / PB90-1) TaxID=452637 RepID=B1ZR70_OPITP|nr:formate--tetrahydrofolate ligase [Opitutus terrae]ACB74560.1 Formate--tetrahydrofolate ligase [Opitutus terrae PB90-1]